MNRLSCFQHLSLDAVSEVARQGIPQSRIAISTKALLKYRGTDTALAVEYREGGGQEQIEQMRKEFEESYKVRGRGGAVETCASAFFFFSIFIFIFIFILAFFSQSRFGFSAPSKPLIVDVLSVEATGKTESSASAASAASAAAASPTATADHDNDDDNQNALVDASNRAYLDGVWQVTPIYDRAAMVPGRPIAGPAIIREQLATTIVMPGWSVVVGRPDAGGE